MDTKTLKALFVDVAAGAVDVDEATRRLRDLPFADLGYAVVDHHRALRVGIPEVIFGAGKTHDQLIGIIREIDAQGHPVLVTRLDVEQQSALHSTFHDIECDPVSRTALLSRKPIEIRGKGTISIVTGGTSDIPVAEEAAITARAFGNDVEKLYDVGVAGVHRLLARRDVIDRATVVIVVAGMEGALASVVGGLVDKPVVAVPTSVGYGASFGGIAALLSMLNSCASGVTVVNIDNGFGAAYAATLMNRLGSE